MNKEILVGEEGYEEMINSPAYLRQKEREWLKEGQDEGEYQAMDAERSKLEAFESERGCN